MNHKHEEGERKAIIKRKQSEAMKRKQGAAKQGKSVKQKQKNLDEEGNAVMQKQAEEEESGGKAVKQKHGDEEDWTVMQQTESKGKQNSKLTVRLRSADNCIVEVEWEVAKQFKTVSLFEVDPASLGGSDPPFLLENVNADVLAIVIDFCRFHVSPDTILGPFFTKKSKPPTNTQYIRQQRIRDWETNFLRLLDVNTIFSLIQAADYLNIQVLLDVSCDFIVQKILNSSLEEVRKMLNLVNDLTPEQQALMLKEFVKWQFL